jgi:glycosyltransferase involved in cell wall biosynthesis
LEYEFALESRAEHETKSVGNARMKPLVTALIDTYNHGSFVEEAIDSVLCQDFPEEQREVLVVDDGSTDDTRERVKKYGSKIRYLYKTNGGQASAFNFGLAHARGEIVSLLDGDDYWLPGKLRRIAEEFEKNSELGMVYHPYLEINMRTGEERKSKFQPISGSLLGNAKEFFWYQAPGTSASFRRKFLEQLLPIPEELRTQADGYIGLLIPLIAPVLAVTECLSTYRFHGNNLYHADGEQMTEEFRRRRAETAHLVIGSADQWLRRNGYAKRARVCGFFPRFLLYSEMDRFRTNPPGRLRFFWFTVKENRAYSPIQRWKMTIINYLVSPLALVFGYKGAQSMYKWRARLTETAHRLFRRFFGRHSSADSKNTARA